MAPPTFSGLTIGLSSFETAFGYGRMWVIHCPGSLVVHLPCPRNRSGTGSPHPPAARPSDYPTLVGPLLLPPPTLRRPPQLAVGLLLLPPPPPLLPVAGTAAAVCTVGDVESAFLGIAVADGPAVAVSSAQYTPWQGGGLTQGSGGDSEAVKECRHIGFAQDPPLFLCFSVSVSLPMVT